MILEDIMRQDERFMDSKIYKKALELRDSDEFKHIREIVGTDSYQTALASFKQKENHINSGALEDIESLQQEMIEKYHNQRTA
jgi:hypothetical protein